MKFTQNSVPELLVKENGKTLKIIKSMQTLDEQDDRVIMRCAEHVDEFKRGFTCDLEAMYIIGNGDSKSNEGRSDEIRDLVLVHINKYWNVAEIPDFEYVFYK